MEDNEKKKKFSPKIKKTIIGTVAAICVISGISGILANDTTAPEIDVLKQNVELGEPVGISDLISVSDNKDSSPDVIITDLPTGVEIYDDDLIFKDTGSFELHAKATDSKNNSSEKVFSVNVNDTKAPVFAENMVSSAGYGVVLPLLNSKSTVDGIYAYADDMSDVTYQIDSVMPVDSTLGTDSYKIIDDVNISFNVPGKYNVNITASDKYGNTSQGIAQVNIIDKTAPVISKSKASFSVTEGGEAPNYSSYVSANDEISGRCAVEVDDSSVDYNTPGTYTVTYTTHDGNGNTVTDSAEVTVNSKPQPKPVSSSSFSPASSGTNAARSSSESSQTVYITRTGSKYHHAGCQYLRQSQIPISLSDAKTSGYSPCSRCF